MYAAWTAVLAMRQTWADMEVMLIDLWPCGPWYNLWGALSHPRPLLTLTQLRKKYGTQKVCFQRAIVPPDQTANQIGQFPRRHQQHVLPS